MTKKLLVGKVNIPERYFLSFSNIVFWSYWTVLMSFPLILSFWDWCESKCSPPGTIVRLLLSEWIKPQCSFVKDYVAESDHNR
jgi:hypothetical protein